MKKFLLAVLATLSFGVNAQSVPQADIDAIAQQTGATSDQIAQWLGSNNGDQLYQTYLSKYVTVPSEQQWQNPATMPASISTGVPGVQAKTLGYYVERSEGHNTYDCNQYSIDPTNIKAEALCTLGYWDIWMQSRVAGGRDSTTEASMVVLFNDLISKSSNANSYDLDTASLLSSVYIRARSYSPNNLTWQNAQNLMGSAVLSKLTATSPKIGWAQPTDGFALFALWDAWLTSNSPAMSVNSSTYTPCGGPNGTGIPSWNVDRLYLDCGIQVMKSKQAQYDLGYWTYYPNIPNVGQTAPYTDALGMSLSIVTMKALYSIVIPSTANPDTSFLNNMSLEWQTDQQNDTLFIHQMAVQYPNTPVIQ
jgi:hypothetical protein